MKIPVTTGVNQREYSTGELILVLMVTLVAEMIERVIKVT